MDIHELRAALVPPDLADYPELAGYTRAQAYHDMIGGGGLYLAARMARTLHLHPNDIVLDLGCGKGETSIFLAQRYGVRVVAVDLWHSATYLDDKFRARGLRDRIIPLHLDASQLLPFGEGYFDAIFALNSLSFFGGSILYLQRLLTLLRAGGEICIASEALSDEFTPEQLANPPEVYSFQLPPPNETVDVFKSDFVKQHTPAWWQSLFHDTGMVRITGLCDLDNAQQLYEELCFQEDEEGTDPFDVQMLLKQFEWGREHRPRKTLFTLTAVKL